MGLEVPGGWSLRIAKRGVTAVGRVCCRRVDGLSSGLQSEKEKIRLVSRVFWKGLRAARKAVTSEDPSDNSTTPNTIIVGGKAIVESGKRGLERDGSSRRGTSPSSVVLRWRGVLRSIHKMKKDIFRGTDSV